MKGRFDLIISDIDGCLGPERHGPVDADGLARVSAWNRRSIGAGGPAVTLCSGRPQPYAEAICRVIANDAAPIVCEMGVWLYDPRDNRYIIDPAITPGDMETVRACTAWIRHDLAPRGFVMQPGKTASISLWHADTDFLMKHIPAIRDRVAAEGWNFRIGHTVAWVNLELAHVSKGSGIDRLTRMMNTPRGRLAGIGDTMGDMAIRERVAFFACPANADPGLKAHADFVATREEIEGVLEILEVIGREP
ncbi:MAG TPA: HAD hydrolase family protein [Phycisphaerales bacterium]|nr:HAD hydrolase family protein [Phycisphaerales bacterium]